jgi:hypothetical protein
LTKPSPPSGAKPAPAVQLDATKLTSWSGSKDPDFQMRLVKAAIGSIFQPSWLSEAERDEAIKAAIAAMAGLAPADELEGMLAAQMVSTHNLAMECLRRATLAEQTFEGRDANLKHAAKLMSLYLQQIGALDKHRGGGKQKITVEHVTVEAGGQAIVGNVNHGSGRKPKRTRAQQGAIGRNSDPVINDTVIETGHARGNKVAAARSPSAPDTDEGP